jgi:hypothetical protein
MSKDLESQTLDHFIHMCPEGWYTDARVPRFYTADAFKAAISSEHLHSTVRPRDDAGDGLSYLLCLPEEHPAPRRIDGEALSLYRVQFQTEVLADREEGKDGRS